VSCRSLSAMLAWPVSLTRYKSSGAFTDCVLIKRGTTVRELAKILGVAGAEHETAVMYADTVSGLRVREFFFYMYIF
jgi:hypothetical protein